MLAVTFLLSLEGLRIVLDTRQTIHLPRRSCVPAGFFL